jgi:hypothetical protein
LKKKQSRKSKSFGHLLLTSLLTLEFRRLKGEIEPMVGQKSNSMFEEIWHYTYEAKDRSQTLTELGEELGVQ